jgi:peptide/nickel transport system ATP-binding protein
MSERLRLERLTIALPRAGKITPVVEDLNLNLAAGEMLALVGESGSGKTITALSIMGLLPRGARLRGNIAFAGQNLAILDEPAMRQLRGRKIGMVFQNPLAALNPAHTIGAQIAEAWRVHEHGSAKDARARALELLDEVGIKNAAQHLNHYPHQFSGGMRQRVMIAMALACGPELLIADEPTTGLDAVNARQIMALLTRLRRERQMSVIFITHDLSVVEEHADSIHVLYAGRSVEWGQASAFFSHPAHAYSAALLGAAPRIGQSRLANIPGQLPEPEALPPGCRFAPRCTRHQPDCDAAAPPPRPTGGTISACLHPLTPEPSAEPRIPVNLAPKKFLPLLEARNISVTYQKFTALREVSLTLGRGECLGIVGESGSGKSSLGRAVLQMQPYQGEILLGGESFTTLRGSARRAQRRRIQIVFQDPRESLNPRMKIGDTIAEALRLSGANKAEAQAQIPELLTRVGLSHELATRSPATLSGGQAQRAAIARALAAQPDIIVLDEPTSSLDVSTQAMLLNLLKDLASSTGISYLLISHDFAVVSYLAERIAVLHQGEIIETGDTQLLIANPQHAYTQALVNAAPHRR